MNDVREIIEGIGYVHNLTYERLSPREMFALLSSFDYDLATLYQYYVVWKLQHKKALEDEQQRQQGLKNAGSIFSRS